MSSILHQVHWLTLILKSDITEHAEGHTECISLVFPLPSPALRFIVSIHAAAHQWSGDHRPIEWTLTLPPWEDGGGGTGRVAELRKLHLSPSDGVGRYISPPFVGLT